MKTRIITFVTAALLLLTSSCNDSLTSLVPGNQEITEITAYTDNGGLTKTGLVDNGSGGKNVEWKSGNAISLFFNSGTNGGDKFTTTTNGPIAKFSGSISAISGDLSESGGNAYFWATYPYNPSSSCDGTGITTSLTATQKAYANDVADDLLVTVGRSQNLSVYFRNTCTIIEFKLSQENISKITFRGNTDERVAGEFKASFDANNKVVHTATANAVKSIEITPAESATFAADTKYYFAFLPGTFSNGYTLTFTRSDGYKAIYSKTTQSNFEVGKFYTMTNKDSGLTFIPSGYVVFADANFKEYCVDHFDKNYDLEISVSEAEDVGYMNVNTDNISSLEGIEYFTNLAVLICKGTESGKGKLSSLDISTNVKLNRLDCSNNQLTELHTSSCFDLGELICNDNRLTTLNFVHNVMLGSLTCTNNRLSMLDFSSCPGMDVCSNPEMARYYLLKGNQITTIKVRKGRSTDSFDNITIIEVTPDKNMIAEYLRVATQVFLLKIEQCQGTEFNHNDTLSIFYSLKDFATVREEISFIDAEYDIKEKGYFKYYKGTNAVTGEVVVGKILFKELDELAFRNKKYDYAVEGGNVVEVGGFQNIFNQLFNKEMGDLIYYNDQFRYWTVKEITDRLAVLNAENYKAYCGCFKYIDTHPYIVPLI